ncbi:MAG: hypothetical protein WBA35_12605 [Litorimonas sp.]
MGIKNLIKLLKRVCPHVFVRKSLYEYRGRCLSVDISFIVNKLEKGHRKYNENVKHTVILINSALDKILSYGIDLVVVFDKERGGYGVLKQLCPLKGLPVIQSINKADPQCAALDILGLCDGVISDDNDMLVYGAKRIIKISFKSGTCIEIERDCILEALDLSYVEFVDLCMLLGSDYTQTLSRDVVRIYNIFKTKRNSKSDTIRVFKRQYYPYFHTKGLYMSPQVIHVKRFDIEKGYVDEEGLKRFILPYHLVPSPQRLTSFAWTSTKIGE